MKFIRNYYKDFIMRGLVAMGFGPMVLAVVYGILDLCGVVKEIRISDLVLGVFTITALAFLAGAITQLYQIEELPLSVAITAHGVILYLGYLLIYLTNGWLKEGIIPFLIFTAIFVIGYVIVWTIIYLITKKNTEKVNNCMKF